MACHRSAACGHSGETVQPWRVQVVVRYKGTHKGKVFDETKGKATFSFCLGVLPQCSVLAAVLQCCCPMNKPKCEIYSCNYFLT